MSDEKLGSSPAPGSDEYTQKMLDQMKEQQEASEKRNRENPLFLQLQINIKVG